MTHDPNNPNHQSTASRGSAATADPPRLLTDDDIHLFNEGTHYRLYEKFGAHRITREGVTGVHFAVWAPNARQVSVVGDFNEWNAQANPMQPRQSSGIWEGFIADLAPGTLYKYHVVSSHQNYSANKADPFGFMHEVPPNTATVIQDLEYTWNDHDWMTHRQNRHAFDEPMSIYEMHLGSWRRRTDDTDRPLTYRELAPVLAEYLNEMGFTHVELMPIMEHPFAGSWGYQTTGYFAPTSRFGSPQDFMYFIDTLHQSGIGVILDWVPSHFPTDEHGLQYFDGTHLYEHADPRVGFHPDWKSSIFNYGRNEVRSFLISNAIYWLDKYHVDGLRVDAVASMLYRDYSRQAGEWIPNEHGGRENLEAIEFLRALNMEVYRSFPDVHTIAEESTAWPMVSRPTYVGGLGFGYKWDMGWMHDTLSYLSRDSIYRQYHHHEITFRAIYQFSENYVLPLSHDEVVHGKGSLIGKMPGDDWQRFANLRLLLTYQWAAPGKKMLFMGGELGQWSEWSHERALDWHLLEHNQNQGVRELVRQLNRIYREESALHECDTEERGFAWLDPNDSEHCVVSFLRHGRSNRDIVAVILNCTPSPRFNYRVGVPYAGYWREIFNSDAAEFGGSGHGNLGGLESAPISYHGHPCALDLTVPPLGAVLLRFDADHPTTQEQNPSALS